MTKAACCRNIEIVLHPTTLSYLYLYIYIYIYMHAHIVAKTRKFSVSKVLNIVYVELTKQIKLHLFPHGKTFYSYAVDDDDPQTVLQANL